MKNKTAAISSAVLLGTAKAYSGFVDFEFDDICTPVAEYKDFT